MFNLKLYKEGLRKTLFIAALFIAIMKIGAVLIPISTILSNIRAIESGWGQGRVVVEGLGSNFALVIAMVAFAPFITLYLFSFLNKRSSSDFYHSLPHKRETIFISYTAAILTWVIGGIWLSTGISLVIYGVGAQHVLLNLSSVIMTTLGLSAGSFLVIAATLMAMSVTGGAFSNIVTALLIVFLPRTVMSAFTSMIVATRIVSPVNFGIFGDISYHIPFSFLDNILGLGLRWGGGGINQVFDRGALYTAVIGLVFLAIALFLFKRRRSETAGNPAQSGVLQNIIRIAVAFVVCVPGLAMIFFNFQHTWRHGDFFLIFAIYAVAVVVYFAYELITTRKMSNIVKALPGLGILVLLNIAFLLGVHFGTSMILNRNIQASEISAVRMEALNPVHSWDGVRPYEEHRASEIEIADAQLTDLLLEALARNVEAVRNPQDDLWRHPTLLAEVSFEQTSGGRVRRNIHLSEAEFRDVLELLDRHPAYADLFLNLPENPEEVQNWLISEDAARAVYEILREEVRTLNLATWRGLRWHGAPMMSAAAYYHEIHVSGFIGRDTYRNIYSLTDATPRALDRFIYHVNAENFIDVEAGLAHAVASSSFDWLTVQGHAEWEGHHFSAWHDSAQFHQGVLEALLEAVRTQGSNPVDRSRPHLSVQFSYWDSNRDFYGVFFFNADEDLLEMFPDRTASIWY